MNKVFKSILCLFNPQYRNSLLLYHVAAGVEHTTIISSLGSLNTVVDIGANRGQFTLVARNCFPNSRIISFEPLPGPAGDFRKVFANDANVVLQEAAIGPDAGEFEMHISARDDSSSLLTISSRQDEIFPGTAEVSTINVSVAPLEIFISATDLISRALLKIDVQGFELEALKGCAALLGLFQYVYIECSFVELYEGQALAHEIILFLHDYGYALNGVYNMHYDKKGLSIQADLLFENQNT